MIEDRFREQGGMSFGDVQERLVEAMLTLWRLPDRERGLMRARASDGPWQLVTPEPGDYGGAGVDGAGSDAPIKPASLTRLEVAEMEEALGWTERLTADDRRIVGLAITELASGQREVRWSRVMRRLGLTRGSDGVRMRYGRAIASIARAQSGGNPRAERVNGVKVQD